jgi:hypothetical protein
MVLGSNEEKPGHLGVTIAVSLSIGFFSLLTVSMLLVASFIYLSEHSNGVYASLAVAGEVFCIMLLILLGYKLWLKKK